LSDVTGYLDVSRRKLAPTAGIDVETDHVPSALNEIAGNCASHDAKPDNSDGLVHASPLVPVENRLTGNARRALSSGQMTNNRQLVSTGQAAFVVVVQSKEELACLLES
jgi:hypothetical protein